MNDFVVQLVRFICLFHLVLSSNYCIWKCRFLFKSVNFIFYLPNLKFFVLICLFFNSFFHVLFIILKSSLLGSNSHADLFIDRFYFLFWQIIFLNLFSWNLNWLLLSFFKHFHSCMILYDRVRFAKSQNVMFLLLFRVFLWLSLALLLLYQKLFHAHQVIISVSLSFFEKYVRLILLKSLVVAP